MGRTSCCDADGLKRGAWTPDEDQKLLAYIQRHGLGSWSSLPPKAGLQRCGKSCRLRWNNYLRPDIKRGEFSLQEDRTIIQLHALLGNKWSAIAAHLPKRTDNEVKRYWNSCLKKRLAMMGIDPVTHKPISTILRPANGDPKKASNLSHMAQWESARLEAEARESQLCQQELPGSTSVTAVASGTILKETTIAPSPDLLKAWQSLLLKPIEGRVGGGDVCGVLGAGSGANYSNGGFTTDQYRSMALDQVEDHGQTMETISNGDGNFFEEIADILLSTNLDNHSLYTDSLITSTGNGGNGELAGMITNNGWNDIVSLLNYGLPNNVSVV